MDRDGGGLVIWYDAPEVKHNIIEGNIAFGGGGGILCVGHINGVITSNFIVENSANMGGGILCSTAASPEISGNIIMENRAHCWGGGVCIYGSSSPPTTNNLIARNWAGIKGGGVSISSVCLLANNTIVGNEAVGKGGGIHCEWDTTTVVNSVLCNNKAAAGSEVYLAYIANNPACLSIRYSNARGGLIPMREEAWTLCMSSLDAVSISARE